MSPSGTSRAKRQGIMLCYPFEEKRLNKWEPPYIIQPKLDGVRCRMLVQPERCLLLSSTEEIITSVPHLNQLALQLMPLGEWDGELYVHGWTFEEINSVVSRTANLSPFHEKLEFHCFDYVSHEAQLERTINLAKLNEGLPSFCPIQVVPSTIAYSLEDLLNQRDIYLKNNYEGIIIRNATFPYLRKRSTGMMKFKPKRSDAYLILDSFEEIDKYGSPKNRLGGLVCCGDDGEQFRVGSGFTDRDRIQLWKCRASLPGKYVLVEYQHTTPGRGVPRFPIFCSIINPENAHEN